MVRGPLLSFFVVAASAMGLAPETYSEVCPALTFDHDVVRAISCLEPLTSSSLL
jgi:hypothetical protein